MLLIESEIADTRLEICRACKHFVKKTASCGTLILGKTIQHKKKKIKLCGCAMPIKTKLKIASCPIGKWYSSFDEKLIEELEKELGKVDGRLTGKQNKKLTDLYNKFTGSKKNVSTCTPCVVKMIETLKEIINGK
jgi:hypothetical protein